jgi:uncharacterized Tic20 family protein
MIEVSRPASARKSLLMSDTHEKETATPVAHVLSPQEDQLWAAVAHLGGLFWFLPALVIFLALRKSGPKTRVESKEALNWQITFLICWVAVDVVVLLLSGIVSIAATAAGASAGLLPTLLLAAVWAAIWLVNAVFSILGFIKVNGGGSYRYPFAFRFIK